MTATHETLKLSNRVKEKIALTAVFLIGRNYYRNDKPWTVEGLAQAMRVPAEATEAVMWALEKSGLVTRTAGESPRYVPNRPPERVPLKEVLDAVRAADEKTYVRIEKLPAVGAVDQLAELLDKACADALQGKTLRDLALSESPEVRAVPDPAAALRRKV